MPLTPEQKQMAEDNVNLAYSTGRKLARKYPIELEESISICLLALVKSVQNFDPSKGFAFSTYAVRNMQWAVYKELNPKKPRLESLSLEDAFTADGQSYWEDFIAGDSPENRIICEIATEQTRDRIYGMLPLNLKNIFLIRCQDPELNQREVADLAGCSQVQVSRVYKRLQKQLMNVAI